MCVYTLPLHLDQEGLGDATDCAVSLLHMEDVPGRAQRCFAAVGCGIRVYQLCSGRLLSSQSSLHHCPLSAILFFRPLRLLATADCDGASEAVSLPPSHTHTHTLTHSLSLPSQSRCGTLAGGCAVHSLATVEQSPRSPPTPTGPWSLVDLLTPL